MALQLLPEEAQSKQLVLTAVKKDGLALAYAATEWRRDAEVLRVALKQSEWAYDYVGNEERQQAPVALQALEQGHALPKQLLSNKEVGLSERRVSPWQVLVQAAQVVQRRKAWEGEVRSLKKLQKMSPTQLIAEFGLCN